MTIRELDYMGAGRGGTRAREKKMVTIKNGGPESIENQ